MEDDVNVKKAEGKSTTCRDVPNNEGIPMRSAITVTMEQRRKDTSERKLEIVCYDRKTGTRRKWEDLLKSVRLQRQGTLRT